MINYPNLQSFVITCNYVDYICIRMCIYIYVYIYIYIYIYISAGPFRGHQAVKDSFQAYNSIASIDRLQTSKYIALLTSMLTASFSAFKSSCNLFLCCYRATGHSCYHPFGGNLKLGSPHKSLQNPSNFRYSFHRFLLPK